MKAHVIKYDWQDGRKLSTPILWCGSDNTQGWKFQDAQHVALAVGGSVAPCKNCIKAIIKTLEEEL